MILLSLLILNLDKEGGASNILMCIFPSQFEWWSSHSTCQSIFVVILVILVSSHLWKQGVKMGQLLLLLAWTRLGMAPRDGSPRAHGNPFLWMIDYCM